MLAWACVLLYGAWVFRLTVIGPLKARRPKPVYKIRDGKIYRA